MLAVAHYRGNAPDVVDRPAIAAMLTAWPRAGVAAYLVDGLASPVPAAIIVLALVIGCTSAKRWRLGVVAAIGPLLAPATTTVLKRLVHRTIHGDNLAFPSGHTAFATAVGVVLGLLLIGLVRPSGPVGGAVLAALALATGGIMAADQISVGAHYPTDTVGGFCTALAVVSTAALLIDSVAERSFRVACARKRR